jgi:hypothetical protein
MKAINWTEIQKKYKGLWVALAKDEVTVLASATTAREAFEKAKKTPQGKKDLPILAQMPLRIIDMIGTGI